MQTSPSLTSTLPTNGSVDQCWTQWSNFLQKNSKSVDSWPVSYGIYNQTSTDIQTFTLDYPVVVSTATSTKSNGDTTLVKVYETTTVTTKVTTTIVDGGFTATTALVTETFTSQVMSANSTYTTTPYTRTYSTALSTSWTTTTIYNASTPACVLPSVVSQCQNRWESYLTFELSPSMTFAGCQTAFYSGSGPVPSCIVSQESYASSSLSMESSLRPSCDQASITGACAHR